MPKIIENLEHRLLSEARKQIENSGYAATTVRSVATACGVGVGTVYNYFPSKEAMVASYLLRDWETCLVAIRAVSAHTDRPEPLIRCIYDQLKLFSALHSAVFLDEAAGAGFGGGFRKYHVLLRRQLAEPLEKFCTDDFTAEFIAEALLTWTMADKGLDEICDIIKKLF